jgi:hypothetical protein
VMTHLTSRNSATRDFFTAFAAVFLTTAGLIWLDDPGIFESVPPSSLRTVAILYQAGWVFGLCFPVAFMAGIAFAVSRADLSGLKLRGLIGGVCTLGVLASIGFYLYNDFVLPELDFRSTVYLAEAKKPGAEHEKLTAVSTDLYDHELREMKGTMLWEFRGLIKSKPPAARWTRLLHEIQVEIHKRYSLAVSPFAFAVMGLAIGLHARAWKGWLAVAVSAGFFIPFLSSLMMIGMACSAGPVPPVAMWAPDIVLLAGGTVVLLAGGRGGPRKDEQAAIPPVGTLW